MSPHDPFELFRRLNPIARETVDEADEARLESILDGSTVVPFDTRRRTRQLVAAGLVVVIVGATAAWAILRREPVADPLTVACHQTADVDGTVTGVAATGDPVKDCAPLWYDGTFGTVGPPELTVCVGDAGLAEVYPGGPDVCERLGRSAPAGELDDAAAERELQRRLSLLFGPMCVGREDAIAFAQATLDDLGLRGWTIELTGPFDDEFPCAGSGVDPIRRTVSIGGVPPHGLVPPASAP
jgi:hypothetical protein